MAGFDDLIPEAMPYLAIEEISGTGGTDWQWDYQITDKSGNLVDFATGFTFAMKLVNRAGVTVYSPTVAQVLTGVLRCTLAASATAADPGTKYLHELTITRTSDGKKIVVVGAGDSEFTVKRKWS